mmetsp:Transcript_29702/g.96752  ORF Transcript_29702/g.96752 Transcript_29702/m.96752 type:complete len:637 (+) Transcript_29702:442-2352(+)
MECSSPTAAAAEASSSEPLSGAGAASALASDRGGRVDSGAGASAPASDDVSERLHIVSWNVASWPTTVKLIREKHGTLTAFLEGHHIDILCLQEAKLVNSRLTKEPAADGALEPGFDTFWALCNPGSSVVRGKNKPVGFNGVATFARVGLTIRADSEAMRDAELDEEGRCIMTEHSTFVLFNVYVPAAGSGGGRAEMKVRFLARLRERIAEVRRETGKAVILVGDLNVSRRKEDVTWNKRIVDAGALLRGELHERREAEGFPEHLAALLRAAHAPFARAMDAAEVVRVPGGTGKYDRKEDTWKVMAPTADGSGRVQLGKVSESESGAHLRFGLGEDDMAEDAEGKLAWVGTDMTVFDLVEVLTKCCGCALSEAAQRSIASLGRSFTSPRAVKELEELLSTQDMVDSFVEFWPEAENRFTAWSQYNNSRYRNEGGRIDYAIVDRGFFEAHAVRGGPLQGGEDENAALAAATGDGLFKQAPFDGSGLDFSDPGPPAYAKQFREQPHTGVLYTPPRFSDHVGVTLLLRGARGTFFSEREPTRRWDATTRKAQPHTLALSRPITAFFAKGAGAAAPEATPKETTAEAGVPAEASLGKRAAGAAAPAAPPPKAAKTHAPAKPKKPLPKGQKAITSLFARNT